MRRRSRRVTSTVQRYADNEHGVQTAHQAMQVSSVVSHQCKLEAAISKVKVKREPTTTKATEKTNIQLSPEASSPQTTDTTQSPLATIKPEPSSTKISRNISCRRSSRVHRVCSSCSKAAGVLHTVYSNEGGSDGSGVLCCSACLPHVTQRKLQMGEAESGAGLASTNAATKRKSDGEGPPETSAPKHQPIKKKRKQSKPPKKQKNKKTKITFVDSDSDFEPESAEVDSDSDSDYEPSATSASTTKKKKKRKISDIRKRECTASTEKSSGSGTPSTQMKNPKSQSQSTKRASTATSKKKTPTKNKNKNARKGSQTKQRKRARPSTTSKTLNDDDSDTDPPSGSGSDSDPIHSDDDSAEEEADWCKDEALQVDLRPSVLHRVRWLRIVLDEAHKIKARTSSTAKAVLSLTSKYKWCLTGTPLQNRINELYALIRFLRIKPFAFFYCRKPGCDCTSLHWNFGR